MSQLPIVPLAQAPSTPALRLRVALATPRQARRPPPLPTPRRAHRLWVVVAAGSSRTVATAAKMAPGGATSLLPIVPSAPAPSTRPVRPPPAVEVLAGATPPRRLPLH